MIAAADMRRLLGNISGAKHYVERELQKYESLLSSPRYSVAVDLAEPGYVVYLHYLAYTGRGFIPENYNHESCKAAAQAAVAEVKMACGL